MSSPREQRIKRHGLTITDDDSCKARAGDCRCDGKDTVDDFGTGYFIRRVTHHCGVTGCGAQWRSRLTESSFDPVRLPNLAQHATR